MKTRIAPSPSGSLHIGGAKTALICWLFAKQQKGSFVVRIEDTDKSRSSASSAKSILNDLTFLGLNWDEGPGLSNGRLYYQSNRLNIYNKFIKKLICDGNAYPCFCDRQRITNVKHCCIENGLPPKYDGKCRRISPSQATTLMRSHHFTIRIKNTKHSIILNDMIFGKVQFNSESYDDFIIVRDNGMPMYNLACVIDDHDMGITHVFRGSEHLQNTPKQIMLYKAIGADIPRFGHLAVVMDPNTKKKMSKRDKGASIQDCVKSGISKDAILLYLSTLGSGVKPLKAMDIKKMIKRFRVDKIKKSPTFFDFPKLLEINNKMRRGTQ